MAALHEKNQTLEGVTQRTGEVILHLEDKIQTQQQKRAADQLAIEESNKSRNTIAIHLITSIKNTGKLEERMEELEESFERKVESDNQIIVNQAAKLTKRKIRYNKIKQKLKLRKQQQQ